MCTPSICSEAKRFVIPFSNQDPKSGEILKISVGDKPYTSLDYLMQCNDAMHQPNCRSTSEHTYFWIHDCKLEKDDSQKSVGHTCARVVVSGEQLHHHHVGQRIRCIYFYGRERVEASTEKDELIILENERIDLTVFPKEIPLETCLEGAYFVISQDSENQYVVKAYIRGLGGGNNQPTGRTHSSTEKEKEEDDEEIKLYRSQKRANDKHLQKKLDEENPLRRVLRDISYIGGIDKCKKDKDWIAKRGTIDPEEVLKNAIEECKRRHGHLDPTIMVVESSHGAIEGTPLQFAMTHVGLRNIVGVLLAAGADANCYGILKSNYPLTMCMRDSEESDTIDLLLQYGADPRLEGFIESLSGYNSGQISVLLQRIGVDESVVMAKTKKMSCVGLTKALQHNASRQMGRTASSKAGEKEKKFNAKATKALYEALTPGKTRKSLSKIMELIEQGANVNDRRVDGITPLGLALDHNYGVNLLVQMGANPNQFTRQSCYPLAQAIAKKSIYLCDILLGAGAAHDYFLQHAQAANWVEGVSWFVEAEVEAGKPRIQTLDGIVMCKRWDLLSNVLDDEIHYPMVFEWLQPKSNTLFQSSQSGVVDKALISRLVSIACREGRQEIANQLLSGGGVASLEAMLEAVKGGHEELLALLLKGGFDRAVLPVLLSAACKGKHQSIATKLIALGATPSETDLQSVMTPGCEELFKLLLSNPYSVLRFFPNLISQACQNEQIEFVKLLLNAMAAPSEADLLGAIKAGNEVLFKLLLTSGRINLNGMAPNLLLTAYQQQRTEMLVHLINEGVVTIEAINQLIAVDQKHLLISLVREGRINITRFPLLLSLARQGGHLQIVQELLNAGAFPHYSELLAVIQVDNKDMFVAFLRAINGAKVGKEKEKEKESLEEDLLPSEEVFSSKYPGNQRFNLLRFAFEQGGYKIVSLLMQQDIDLRDRDVCSFLLLSAERGWNEVIRGLGKSGAKVSQSPFFARNPLIPLFTRISSLKDVEADQEVVDILVRYGADVTQLPKPMRLRFKDVLHDHLRQKVGTLISRVLNNIPTEQTKALTDLDKIDELDEVLLQVFIPSDFVIHEFGKKKQDPLIYEEIFQAISSRLNQLLLLEKFFHIKKAFLNCPELLEELQNSLLAVQKSFDLKNEKKAERLNQTAWLQRDAALKDKQIQEARENTEKLIHQQKESTETLLKQQQERYEMLLIRQKIDSEELLRKQQREAQKNLECSEERAMEANRLATKEIAARLEKIAKQDRLVATQNAQNIQNEIWRAKMNI